MSYFPNPADTMKILEPGFRFFMKILENDLSRTVIMIILLATIMIRVLQTILNKSPLKESSVKIAIPLGLAATLSITYKFKGALDQVSWLIFIGFLIALIAPLFSKLGIGKFFSRHGTYGDYGYNQKKEKRTEKSDKKLNKDAVHDTMDLKHEEKKEDKIIRTEDDLLDRLHSDDLSREERRNLLHAAYRSLIEAGRK